MPDMFDRLVTVKAVNPPRIIIYGPPGFGKTTLASEFPSPVFLQVEDGTPSGVELVSFGKLESYSEVKDAIASIYNNEHPFKTLVLDSADKFEPILWAEVCAKGKWKTITEPSFQRGYTEADYLWRDIIKDLNNIRLDRQMNIVIICHSAIERFDDPSTASYSQYDVHLHKRAKAILCDEADAILLVKQDVSVKQEEHGFNKTRAIGEGVNRFIYTEGRPAFNAKNRYGMPSRIRYDKGQGYAAIGPYFPGYQPPETASIEGKAK